MKTNNFKLNLLLFMFISLHFSCSEILFEQDISESYVTILAPTNDATVTSGNISFNWEKIEDASKYHIQIATPNFANAKQIVSDSTVTNTSFITQLLPNNYEWRVRGENSAFETDYFTNLLYVKEVEDFSDYQVILISPIDNLVTNQDSQTFTWELVPDATEYRIQIWQPDTNGTLEHDEVVNTTSFIYDFDDNNYLWQIRAQNSTQNTGFSSRKLLIDTLSPNTPDLETPQNNTSVSEGEISFTWQRNDIVGSIESDSIFAYSDVELSNLIFKDKAENKTYKKDLLANTYYWNAQGFDQSGNKSSLSTTFKLEVN